VYGRGGPVSVNSGGERGILYFANCRRAFHHGAALFARDFLLLDRAHFFRTGDNRENRDESQVPSPLTLLPPVQHPAAWAVAYCFDAAPMVLAVTLEIHCCACADHNAARRQCRYLLNRFSCTTRAAHHGRHHHAIIISFFQERAVTSAGGTP